MDVLKNSTSVEIFKRFKEMFKEYRSRTEMSAPHIYISVEDTMFLDNNRLVSLECVYYTKDDAKVTNLNLKDI